MYYIKGACDIQIAKLFLEKMWRNQCYKFRKRVEIETTVIFCCCCCSNGNISALLVEFSSCIIDITVLCRYPQHAKKVFCFWLVEFKAACFVSFRGICNRFMNGCKVLPGLILMVIITLVMVVVVPTLFSAIVVMCSLLLIRWYLNYVLLFLLLLNFFARMVYNVNKYIFNCSIALFNSCLCKYVCMVKSTAPATND